MGERRLLNSYNVPDFDPSNIPMANRPRNRRMNVRTMIPISIRCDSCGDYTYRGTKVNFKKESAIGETYLGIQIYRFYFKCPGCSAEIVMKTDPQNSSYAVELGASRES